MQNPYIKCPVYTTEHFTLRLIQQEDSTALFHCYNDRTAVAKMNDDNCDFGFYVATPEKMAETVGWWIEFYKKGYFIRFAIVDNASASAVGTVEGFCGDTGVLRVDISTEYEKSELLCELFTLCAQRFGELFGNKELVTKAGENATERRTALEHCGWNFIDKYKGYNGYYKVCL